MNSKSISWQVWLIGVPVAHLLLAASGAFETPLFALLTGVSASLASGASMFAFKRFWLDDRTGGGKAGWAERLTLAVSALLAAASVSVVMATVTNEFGFDIARLISGLLFYGWFLFLGSELIGERFEFRGEMGRLSAIRAQLRAVDNWQNTGLIATRESAIERIRNRVASAKVRLESSTALADSLDLSETAIRPLLEEIDLLTSDTGLSEIALLDKSERKRTLRTVLTAATEPNPALNLTIAAFTATTWIATGLGMHSVLVGALGATIGGAGQYLLMRFVSSPMARLLATMKLGGRLPILLLLWAFISVLAGIAPMLLAEIPLAALGAVGVQSAIVTLAFAAVYGYRLVGEDLRVAVEEQNRKYERLLVEHSTQLRQLRERLHHLVHGELQSALVATQRKLGHSRASESGDRQAILAEIETVVDTISHRVEVDEPVNLMETVNVLREIWGDVMPINFQASIDARDALESNAVTASVISDVVIEAVTNAAKHDTATSVDVRLTLAEPRTALLRVTSVGSAEPKRSSAKGSGTRLFNEVCLNWQLSVTRSGSSLTATLPILEAKNDVQ